MALLERFADSSHVTRLLGHGCNRDSAFLVMTAYAGSLSAWRSRQKADPLPCLRLYLRAFIDTVAAVKVRSEEGASVSGCNTAGAQQAMGRVSHARFEAYEMSGTS